MEGRVYVEVSINVSLVFVYSCRVLPSDGAPRYIVTSLRSTPALLPVLVSDRSPNPRPPPVLVHVGCRLSASLAMSLGLRQIHQAPLEA